MGSRSLDSKSSGVVACLIALMAVLAPGIGGAIGLWSIAILLAGLGCLMVFAPPRRSLGLLANLICATLLLLSCSAWLPADWFTPPFWRSILQNQFDVILPSTRSPQPWLTLEASCLLVGNLAWMYFVFTHPWRQNTRRIAVRIFAVGILVLTILALVGYWSGHKIPPWPRVVNSPADFGFFAKIGRAHV